MPSQGAGITNVERGLATTTPGTALSLTKLQDGSRSAARPIDIDEAHAAADRLSLVAAHAFTALPESMRHEQLDLAFLNPDRQTRLLLAIKPVYYSLTQQHLPLQMRQDLWVQSYLRDLHIVIAWVRRGAADWLHEALAE